MKTIADYLALVPPEHASDARFMAELKLLLQPIVDQQAFLASLPDAFDLDTAIGVQLDAVGAWAGVSREIPVPVLNPWFSWDTANKGWGQGYWKGPYEGSALSALDDDTFRRLIRAKILANNSDGTVSSLQAIVTAYFGDPTISSSDGLGDFVLGESSIGPSGTAAFVVDATDYPGAAVAGVNAISLEMVVVVAGSLPTIVDLSILQQLLLPIQAAGTRIRWAVTTVDTAPVFGWGLSNGFFGGWGTGSWGASPEYVIENILL